MSASRVSSRLPFPRTPPLQVSTTFLPVVSIPFANISRSACITTDERTSARRRTAARTSVDAVTIGRAIARCTTARETRRVTRVHRTAVSSRRRPPGRRRPEPSSAGTRAMARTSSVRTCARISRSLVLPRRRCRRPRRRAPPASRRDVRDRLVHRRRTRKRGAASPRCRRRSCPSKPRPPPSPSPWRPCSRRTSRKS